MLFLATVSIADIVRFGVPNERVALELDDDLPVTRFMNNTNFASHNLPGGGCDPVVPSNHTTALACQAACDTNFQCDMWTFVPASCPANPSSRPWCCLKTCEASLGHTSKARHGGGCELPNAQLGVVSGAKDPADWTVPNCTSEYCFTFEPDWSSGSTATTLPTGNFSVRKVEAVRYKNRTYAYADIVPFSDYFYPDSYSSEIGVFSSEDGLRNWTYHGIVIPRGVEGSWDAGGVASPGAAVAENGAVILGYAAESNANGHYGTRGIGIASAQHPLGPFRKHTEPLASPFRGGVCSSSARAWSACDDVVMQSRPGEVHLYHSVKGSALSPGPGIRHRMSTDCGRTWGTSRLVLSSALQPGTHPAETIAGKFFPGILHGKGGMVLITDGGPDFGLHAYMSKTAGDMTTFVAAQQVQLSAAERLSAGWANMQLEFVPISGPSRLGVAYALYTDHRVWSQEHNKSMPSYTHRVFKLAVQPHSLAKY